MKTVCVITGGGSGMGLAAAKSAQDLGKKGIRVCSLSPGLIATDMGNLEAEEGGDLIKTTAEKRMGKAEELGFAIGL